MPIPFYPLDDRSFEDLVGELLARIPGHTPEWTNPRVGDPGRTLIELFAWLGDTLLYRANLVPERQRLAFLRLLNIPMRPARAAEGLVVVQPAQEKLLRPVTVPLYTPVKGPVGFESCGELSVLPLQGELYARRRPSAAEKAGLDRVIRGLATVYNVRQGEYYITTPLFADGPAPAGHDLARTTVDQTLWIALLAPKPEPAVRAAVRKALIRDQDGARVLNVGISPRLTLPRFDETVGTLPAARNLWVWEITSGRREKDLTPEYLTLSVVEDGTDNLTRQGVVRLELPDADDIGLPQEPITRAGVGPRPPRLDDAATAGRLIAWIRLRPQKPVSSFSLSWAGINAVAVDQRTTLANVLAGNATGIADQTLQLPGCSVDPASLVLQVEEPGAGFVPWHQVEDLAAASRDDRAYLLDAEAGVVTFGDGIRGKLPAAGMRIRIVSLRYGGGSAGNLASGNLSGIAQAGLKVAQPLATTGGTDAEDLDQALKRIPQWLKHGDRAVTEEDYRRLALETPAADLGRVEVLPRFRPRQRRFDVPGVVTVMVLPKAPVRLPPNPRPDRIFLERVHDWLAPRRPLATELNVIGVDYVPLAVCVAVTVLDGQPRDLVLRQVRETLRDYLWPLAPGGIDGSGWGLGQAVVSQELEVAVARVQGVRTVAGVNLFSRKRTGSTWIPVPVSGKQAQRLALERWQLPELLQVVAVEGDQVPAEVSEANDTLPGSLAVAIPVVPEVC